MKKGKNRIFIGTSGYNYRHWGGGIFYPATIPSRQWLEYYSRHFNSVELNVTFYRLPSLKAFAGWYRRSPKNFRFVIKGSRFITHLKRLKDSKENLRIFFKNAAPLKEKLAAVLWQFPANFHLNLERLSEFTARLKKNKLAKKVPQVFEFRHPSWFCPEVYSLLGKHNFCLCIAHSNRWPTFEITTADFTYLRFHGGKSLYSSNYSPKELKKWADKARVWLREGKDFYAYFNNDARGFAVKNAIYFKKLLKK